MNLHKHSSDFNDLAVLTAKYMNLPESAVRRDYYITLMLKQLSDSKYSDSCVFKGGTSLSKCYPGSINRFSEDIDLTYLGLTLPDKECERNIKQIEKIMSQSFNVEKISSERSVRSKSMFCWFDNKKERIKLEIGSNVRPDPFSKKKLKSYIQEFLESQNGQSDVDLFELESIDINVLSIERTFIDKLLSVKRHAYCGTLNRKVRHIYDVTKLYQLNEIQTFLNNKDELKRLMKITKATDSFYLTKRNISSEYDPQNSYNFLAWKSYFNDSIKSIYEDLHNTLLYTNIKQDFTEAMQTFNEINQILIEIDE